MLFRFAPLAVNTRPAVVYVNFICFVEAPTVHLPVAGGRFLPLAAYPPVAEISEPIDPHVEMPPFDTFRMLADADVLCRAILNTPAPSVMVPEPAPRYRFARV